ncbi:MAG: hypothetical protein JKY70_12515 [Mucilaginibacter sp.]|nr:hypothetical protein [Mucilaginibacter sp.]
MNTETEYLKSIAEEIIASPPASPAKPNRHLQVEARRLEKAIIHNLNTIENFTQRDTFRFNKLSKLVNVCDILYEHAGTLSANVTVLLDLLLTVKQVVPSEIRPNLKLPKAFVETQSASFKAEWMKHQTVLENQGVDRKLIGISAMPFLRFINKEKNLCWGDFTWLKGYQSKLEYVDWSHADCNTPTEALISLLIGRNYNDDRFYIYCKKYIEARTKNITGKRNRLLEYAKCEKLVLEDTQIGMPHFDVHANSVSDRLLKWIKEEIDFVETHEKEKPHVKLVFKWNVEMIAFFFKLLHERQSFGKIPLEPFAEAIAANCSSVGKEEFQPATIHSRFYMKDVQVIKSIEALLADMLDDVRKYLR